MSYLAVDEKRSGGCFWTTNRRRLRPTDRILDSERVAQTGRELRGELASSKELAGDRIRQAAAVMAEQMLAAEVDEAFGPGSYQRHGDDGQVG